MQDSDGISDGRGVECSVLVPVFNEERYIAHSVRAMQAQRFPGNIEFLFADGGSSDRTRAVLAEFARQDPRIRVFHNPRGTTASGLNLALAHARGRWVARMDAHTEYADDYLLQGVRRLADGDTPWVSGPPVPIGNGHVSRGYSLAVRTWFGRGGSRKWAAELNGAGPEYELDSGVFAGVWERRTLLELGGWDELWFRNEDSEMAGRFLARGDRLVCLPAMSARYTPRNSLLGLWRQYFQYGEYRVKTAVRHPHTMRRSHVFAPALVIVCAAAFMGPARMRRAARALVGGYLISVTAGSVPAIRFSGDARDAGLVPIVLGVMHLAHGAGALRGAMRHGLPLAGMASAFGLRRTAARLRPDPQAVFAPSLQLESHPRP